MTIAHISAQLDYETGDDTTFLFSVTAAETAHQHAVSETITVDPNVDIERLDVGEPATHQLLRLTVPAGEVRIDYRATIEFASAVDDPATLDEPSLAELPAPALPYLHPSRYCPSDRLGGLATRLFGDLPPGFERVTTIRDWVQSNLTYEGGTTDGSTDACDVLVQRVGVCRDYAHVMITLCRSLGIAARYVSGYGVDVDPPDFHGFVEVFLGDGWYLMDPTGMAPPNGLVRIAHGRDAADTAFSTFVGEAQLVDKTVSITSSSGASDDKVPTSTA